MPVFEVMIPLVCAKAFEVLLHSAEAAPLMLACSNAEVVPIVRATAGPHMCKLMCLLSTKMIGRCLKNKAKGPRSTSDVIDHN